MNNLDIFLAINNANNHIGYSALLNVCVGDGGDLRAFKYRLTDLIKTGYIRGDLKQGGYISLTDKGVCELEKLKEERDKNENRTREEAKNKRKNNRY